MPISLNYSLLRTEHSQFLSFSFKGLTVFSGLPKYPTLNFFWVLLKGLVIKTGDNTQAGTWPTQTKLEVLLAMIWKLYSCWCSPKTTIVSFESHIMLLNHIQFVFQMPLPSQIFFIRFLHLLSVSLVNNFAFVLLKLFSIQFSYQSILFWMLFLSSRILFSYPFLRLFQFWKVLSQHLFKS